MWYLSADLGEWLCTGRSEPCGCVCVCVFILKRCGNCDRWANWKATKVFLWIISSSESCTLSSPDHVLWTHLNVCSSLCGLNRSSWSSSYPFLSLFIYLCWTLTFSILLGRALDRKAWWRLMTYTSSPPSLESNDHFINKQEVAAASTQSLNHQFSCQCQPIRSQHFKQPQ